MDGAHSVGSAHSAVGTHGWCPHCDVSVHSAHSWMPLVEVLSVRLVPWMSATVLVPNVARCPWIVPTVLLSPHGWCPWIVPTVLVHRFSAHG
jgi:hypothetical protein